MMEKWIAAIVGSIVGGIYFLLMYLLNWAVLKYILDLPDPWPAGAGFIVAAIWSSQFQDALDRRS